MSIEYSTISTQLAALYSNYRKPDFDMTRSLAPPLKPFEVTLEETVTDERLEQQEAWQFFKHNIDYLSDDQNHNRGVVTMAFQKLRENNFNVTRHVLREFAIGTFHAITFINLRGKVRVVLNYFEPAVNVLPWGDLKRRLAKSFDQARKQAGADLSIAYRDSDDNAEDYTFEIRYGERRLMRVTFEGYSPGMAYMGNQAPNLEAQMNELRHHLGYIFPFQTTIDTVLRHNGFLLAQTELRNRPGERSMEYMYQRGRAVAYVEFTL